ncbi:MAG: hypothetical protein Q9221_002488 [Calogaya cf. arnoldii]
METQDPLISGFTVLDGKINPVRINEAWDQIVRGLVQPIKRYEIHHEYSVTDVCQEICAELLATFNLVPIKLLLKEALNLDQFDSLNLEYTVNLDPTRGWPYPDPSTIRFGQFSRERLDNSHIIRSEPGGYVFVAIAITALAPANGWLTFHEGSHLMDSPEEVLKCRPKPMSLHPGRAMVWHGDLAYTTMSGGGGTFINLILGPFPFPETTWSTPLFLETVAQQFPQQGMHQHYPQQAAHQYPQQAPQNHYHPHQQEVGHSSTHASPHGIQSQNAAWLPGHDRFFQSPEEVGRSSDEAGCLSREVRPLSEAVGRSSEEVEPSSEEAERSST